MHASLKPEAIFVVGASRSGTTLMRQLLQRSPEIAIAPENHFLGHLRESEGARYYFRRAGDLTDDAAVRRVVDMIYSGEFSRLSRWRDVSGFWRWLVNNVPREELERRLLAAERSERGLFAAFLRTYADQHGRPVMGEKTPHHLAHIDTLLEWFPDARVIHMLRDPRGVYVSDLRRRRNRGPRRRSWFRRVPGPLLAPLIMVQTTLVWPGAVRRHLASAERHPQRYMLVRFEDLVREPEQQLARLSAFLGIEIPSDERDVKVVSRGFMQGETGLDAAAADRWRQHIGGFARRWLELWLGGPMRRAGYLPERS